MVIAHLVMHDIHDSIGGIVVGVVFSSLNHSFPLMNSLFAIFAIVPQYDKSFSQLVHKFLTFQHFLTLDNYQKNFTSQIT